MRKMVVCWAGLQDKNFFERSISIDWEFEYINDIKELGSKFGYGGVNLVVIKLEKRNVLNIIRQKKQLQTLQDHFRVPIIFLVDYSHRSENVDYQLLKVDDTEIVNISAENIEYELSRIENESLMSAGLWMTNDATSADSKSYQYVVS